MKKIEQQPHLHSILEYRPPTAKDEQYPRYQSVIIDDPLPAAAVSCVNPKLIITAEPSFSGRVGFRIEGDAEQIRDAFQALSDDKPIGARTLIDAIKKLRTEMFRVKAAGQGVPR